MCHTDFMNDTLLKSYNRSFNGGKSRFARICDNVFSALLLTAALYLLVSRKLHHGAASLFAAMLISASILLTASLLRSLRFNAHIKKLRRETSESILRRRILVSPEVDEVIRSLHRSSSEYPNQVYPEQSATRSFYLLRTEKAITFDDILPIIREALEKGISHIVIYSVSKPAPEAESAVRTVGTTAVEFRLLETIPQIRERFLPDDAEIDSEIKAAFPPAERVSVRVRAERAASKLRTEKHASKYFFAGMGLYALSFFSAYRFYMRFAASAMMFAAMLLFIRKITASSKPEDSRR